MGVIGFSYSRFDAKREEGKAVGGIEVKHNLNVEDVTKTSLNVGNGTNDVLSINFSFTVLYGGGIGKIEVGGNLIYADTDEIVSETLKKWKKDKQLPDMVKEIVNKFVYNKGIITSIGLSDSLGLPTPIPMPKLSFKANKK